jgi:HEAT repeat protein
MKYYLSITIACMAVFFVAGDTAAAENSVGSCLASLKYGDPVARRNAVWFLGHIGQSDREAVEGRLLGLLDDRDPLVRATAAWAIGELSPPAPKAVDALARALTDADANVRICATVAMGRNRQWTQKALDKASKGDNSSAATLATTANTGKIPDSARGLIEHAVKALSHEATAIALSGAWMLRCAGVGNSRALRALDKAIDSTDDDDIRAAAIEAIGHLGLQAGGVLAKFAKAAGHKNPRVRIAAAYALGQVGPVSDKVVPMLIEALGDRNRSVQLASVAALGHCGKTAVDALWKLLSESDANTRQLAADALAGIGHAAVPGLVKALNGKDAAGRKLAAEILGKAGPPARAAIPVLVNMLADDDLHLTALEALGGIMPASKSVLIEMLHDDDPVRRKQGVHALGSGGRRSESAIADLIKALSDPYRQVAVKASWALGRIGSPATGALIDIVADRKSKGRPYAIIALGHTGVDAAEACDTLAAALKDDDVAWLAAETLGRIGPSAKGTLQALADVSSRGGSTPLRQAACRQARLARSRITGNNTDSNLAGDRSKVVNRIELISTVRELRTVRPITIRNYDLRVGLGPGGINAGPWKLLYCMVTPLKKPTAIGPPRKGRRTLIQIPKDLGPVKFTVDNPASGRLNGGVKVLFSQIEELVSGVPIYCGTVHTPWEGSYRVCLWSQSSRLLAQRIVRVNGAPVCYWQGFVKRMRGGGKNRADISAEIDTNPQQLFPTYNGQDVLWVFRKDQKVALARRHNAKDRPQGIPLPGQLPVDEFYKRQMIPPNTDSKKPVELLKVSLGKDGKLEVVLKRLLNDKRLDEVLLARWWVNGRAVKPPPANLASKAEEMQEMLKAIRDEVDPTTSIHVNFPSLPPHIKAKAGDLISLQLMYCPGGSETFSVIGRKERFHPERLMELRKVQASNRGMNIPFLSNRLEFKFTNKMVFDMKRNRKQ